jgi:DNA polymerase III alpha subunit (gram-positive type)
MAKRDNLLNLNGNLLCAIDIATTGNDPFKDEIIEICIVPLTDSIEMDEKTPFFEMRLKPTRPFQETIKRSVKKRAVEAMVIGVDPFQAAELLEQWFESLKLRWNKNIVPLGHDWALKSHFLIHWLRPKTFHYIFNPNYRDLMQCAAFENDRHELNWEQPRFTRLTLGPLAIKFGTIFAKPRIPLHSVQVIAHCYKRMLAYCPS